MQEKYGYTDDSVVEVTQEMVWTNYFGDTL